MPESFRWLAQNGKKEEAMKRFQDIALKNGRKLTPEIEKNIADILDTCDETDENQHQGGHSPKLSKVLSNVSTSGSKSRL
jgi:hypothetical protein